MASGVSKMSDGKHNACTSSDGKLHLLSKLFSANKEGETVESSVLRQLHDDHCAVLTKMIDELEKEAI
jgi:hypothetical protein